MTNFQEHVNEKIQANNDWYINSQFEWAERNEIKRIYSDRSDYFKKILKKKFECMGIMSLLDYGCGDGYWTYFFSTLNCCTRIIGVDYNKLRIERAQKKVKNAIFFVDDLNNNLSYLGKFDIIFCSQVIEHIQDDEKFLKNIKNYLNTGGILILGTPNEGSLLHRLNYFFNKNLKTASDHIQYYTLHNIQEKITNAGFKIHSAHFEVVFLGSFRLYYFLTSHKWGYQFLKIITKYFPSQCSDFYFECKSTEEKK